MKLFIYEYSSASPDAPMELRREGRVMLLALLHDLNQITGASPFTILASPTISVSCPWIEADLSDERKQFQRCAQEADHCWIIAPECDQILLERTQWAQEVGASWIGCSPQVIALATDKSLFGEHLRSHQIPTPDILSPSNVTFPVVAKLRDGAGSQEMRVLRDPHELDELGERFILQPMLPGEPVSVALLAGPHKRLILPPASQRLTQEGRFQYLGGELPISPHKAARARLLAERVVDTLSGLKGYVGLDMILGDVEDGARDFVIGLNPRLTTSYVGLQALCEDNLAEVMLRLARGEEAGPVRWLDRVVHFTAEGEVSFVKIR